MTQPERDYAERQQALESMARHQLRAQSAAAWLFAWALAFLYGCWLAAVALWA